MVVSIVLARYIGLPGVYVGTVIQGLIANVIKPYYVYRDIFHHSIKEYYIQNMQYGILVLFVAFICRSLRKYFLAKVDLGTIVCGAIIIAGIINLFFFVFNYQREEFKNITKKFKKKLV